MLQLKKIERWKDITPEIVNKLVGRINTLSKITGGRGIRVITSPTGIHLSSRVPSVKKGDISVSTNVYSVKIQAGGVPANNTGPFSCKLLDSDGNETGDAISVYPRTHLGTNNFNAAVWPDLAAADNLSAYRDLDGKWYFNGIVFDDTTTCA